ncbi:hypothetical protein EELLY_v1c01010 [Entomoplasma ellychniae]|uniref:Uncharacterized protein n=1 Tax=Entomoplasma ellychniae TaxID=2114 RepID=A0A8E2UAD7_9MOLU|nr:hypothetical protein [Entomoplasma ellychniae]PPE04426.1 hypothetical protein EELLY_v1c01010 [Entomoplasma ellychniae]
MKPKKKKVYFSFIFLSIIALSEVSIYLSVVKIKDKKIDISYIKLDINSSNDLTKEKVLEALKKSSQIHDLTTNDFLFVKNAAVYGQTGSIQIQASSDSTKIKGSVTLTIPALDPVDVSNEDLGLKISNDLTKEQVLEALKKATGINDLTLDDFNFNKKDADYGKAGSITITSPADSTKIKVDETLTIPALDPVDVSNEDLGLNVSNDLTKEQVLEALRKATGINDLTLDDFNFNKKDADYGQPGSIKITSPADSTKIKVDETLTIPALDPVDVSNEDLGLNVSNDLTKEQVLEALKKATGINDLTLDDFNFNKNDADYGKAGSIKITSPADSTKIKVDETLTIPALDPVDVSNEDLGLNVSNDLTKEQVLEALKKATGINDLTLDDFNFNKKDADYGKAGSIKITSPADSTKIKVDETLTIPALDPVDVSNEDLGLNVSNDLTKEQVLEALKKATGINDLTLDDFNFNKKDADYGKAGSITITSPADSTKIKVDETLTIPALDPVDVSIKDLGLKISNDLTKEQVLEALKKATGIDSFTLEDFDFNKNDADYGQPGSIKITSPADSIKIKIDETLTIPALDPVDVSIKDLGLKISNDLTKEQVLEALRKATGINDLTLEDFDFNKTNADYGQPGSIKITSPADSIKIKIDETLTIPALDPVDVSIKDLGLKISNDLPKEQVLEALKKATGINDLTLDDFNFNKKDADYGKAGSITITSPADSIKIKIDETLTIPALDPVDVSNEDLGLNVSNDLTKEQVLEALRKVTGIDSLTLEDFDFNKTNADYGQPGSITITSPADSIKIKIDETLTIPALDPVDVSNEDLGLNVSNHLTKEQVLEALRKVTGIDSLTLEDFDFNKTNADYGQPGSIKITSPADSTKIKIDETLTIPALDPVDVSIKDLGLKISNDLTKEQVLEALKKATGINDLTLEDFDFNKTNADYGQPGSITITSPADSIKIKIDETLTIPALDPVDVSIKDLGLKISNDLTKEQVLEALKKATGINDLTLEDFDFNKTNADYGKAGSITITSPTDSTKIKGHQVLRIPALLKLYDISNPNLGLKISNDLTKEEVLAALKKVTGISDLTSNDFSFSKNNADYDKDGSITISSSSASTKIKGSQFLRIPALLKLYDISNLNLGLKISNDLSKEQVLEALKKVTGISDLTSNDFSFSKNNADYGKDGSITISSSSTSTKIKGHQVLRIPALLKLYDISNPNLGLKISNDLTKEEVLAALKKVTGISDLTSNDFSFSKNNADYDKNGSITISSSSASTKIKGSQFLRIPALVKDEDTSQPSQPTNSTIYDVAIFESQLQNKFRDANPTQILNLLKQLTGNNTLTQDDFYISTNQGFFTIYGQTKNRKLTGYVNVYYAKY